LTPSAILLKFASNSIRKKTSEKNKEQALPLTGTALPFNQQSTIGKLPGNCKLY
jgi:hypothetical protein